MTRIVTNAIAVRDAIRQRVRESADGLYKRVEDTIAKMIVTAHPNGEVALPFDLPPQLVDEVVATYRQAGYVVSVHVENDRGGESRWLSITVLDTAP